MIIPLLNAQPLSDWVMTTVSDGMWLFEGHLPRDAGFLVGDTVDLQIDTTQPPTQADVFSYGDGGDGRWRVVLYPHGALQLLLPCTPTFLSNPSIDTLMNTLAPGVSWSLTPDAVINFSQDNLYLSSQETGLQALRSYLTLQGTTFRVDLSGTFWIGRAPTQILIGDWKYVTYNASSKLMTVGIFKDSFEIPIGSTLFSAVVDYVHYVCDGLGIAAVCRVIGTPKQPIPERS